MILLYNLNLFLISYDILLFYNFFVVFIIYLYRVSKKKKQFYNYLTLNEWIFVNLFISKKLLNLNFKYFLIKFPDKI